MTELQAWAPRTGIAVSTPQDVAVQRLGEWAQSADAAYQVAERLASSSFVPAQFKGKPVELTAAILSGLELGLSPMAAMRAFDVIQGQAAPRAITLRAVVQAHGHEMVLLESTNTRCRMKGRRRGSDEWQSVSWTMDRAKDLGLATKDGWRKQPGAMLIARATSELARLIASDAILGIGYSAEEVADGSGVDVLTGETESPTAGTRKMSRRLKPAPPVPDEPESATAEPDVMLDPKSSLAKAMFASFNEASITDRDDRLAYVSRTVGREVTSSGEMTEDDARKVLEALAADSGVRAADGDAEDEALYDVTNDESWGQR